MVKFQSEALAHLLTNSTLILNPSQEVRESRQWETDHERGSDRFLFLGSRSPNCKETETSPSHSSSLNGDRLLASVLSLWCKRDLHEKLGMNWCSTQGTTSEPLSMWNSSPMDGVVKLSSMAETLRSLRGSGLEFSSLLCFVFAWSGGEVSPTIELTPVADAFICSCSCSATIWYIGRRKNQNKGS